MWHSRPRLCDFVLNGHLPALLNGNRATRLQHEKNMLQGELADKIGGSVIAAVLGYPKPLGFFRHDFVVLARYTRLPKRSNRALTLVARTKVVRSSEWIPAVLQDSKKYNQPERMGTRQLRLK